MLAQGLEDLEEEAVGGLAIQVALSIRLPVALDDGAGLSRFLLDPGDLGEGGLCGLCEAPVRHYRGSVMFDFNAWCRPRSTY